MPNFTVPKSGLATGPGYLLLAVLGTDLPVNTVTGSVFTDEWPVGWALLGVTKTGSEFHYKIGTANIDAEEFFDPLQIVTTDRAASIKFELMQIKASMFKTACNGGTLTVTGSSGTTLNHYTPAAPGAEVRTMVGWESQDATERLIIEQAFQSGEIVVARQKGANNATIPLEFAAEIPDSGFPFQYWTAGTVRG